MTPTTRHSDYTAPSNLPDNIPPLVEASYLNIPGNNGSHCYPSDEALDREIKNAEWYVDILPEIIQESFGVLQAYRSGIGRSAWLLDPNAAKYHLKRFKKATESYMVQLNGLLED